MFILAFRRRIRYIVNRHPHLKYFLLTCFFSSTLVFFLILSQNRRKNYFEDDAFHLTAIDHKGEHDSFGVLVPASYNSNKKRANVDNVFAYVTLLCQESDLPQIRVIVFSLKRTKTKFPIIVMMMPGISQKSKQEVEQLGAIVRDIEPIEWKFVRSGSNKIPSFDKRCRLSKLNLWRFVEFEKLIYLDSTLLIISVRK
jgi:alpha-N-acetylglucosamine transferase